MAKVSKRNDVKKEVTLFNRNELINRINFDKDMISLTDLWKESGSPNNKRPIDWQKVDSTVQLVETMGAMFQSGSHPLWSTRRGSKNPGTYAHKSIALAYAKYLDPKLHVLVNEIFFQRVEEEKNPGLAIERGINSYKKQGKSDEWISKRLKGKDKRNEFTACLAAHGVEKEGFKNCTNAIYNPLFGGSTAVIRERKGIPENANIRDNLSSFELDTISYIESLSKQTIEKENLQGDAKCEIACSRASKTIADALVQHKKPISIII